MSDLTTDPNNPNLTRGVDDQPVEQAKTYLVLTPEERAKGFVRPVRYTYKHVGQKPTHPLRDLTPEEQVRYEGIGYAKYEAYPEGTVKIGRFWTREQLDRKVCNGVTSMGQDLSETYARDPKFYGSTYCCGCHMHRPVAEFVWVDDNQIVGS